MTNVVLCPNCHGSKLVSTPPMIAGSSHRSYGSSGTETYPCPVCNGEGWVDAYAGALGAWGANDVPTRVFDGDKWVDIVERDDFDAMKTIVLSAFETSENLMDECVKRGERIADLESFVNRRYGDMVDCKARIKELEANNTQLRNAIRANHSPIHIFHDVAPVDHVYESAVSERIGELEAKVKSFRSNNRDLKTIAANSESYTHRMDELLGDCKSDVKQRDKRIKELESELAEGRALNTSQDSILNSIHVSVSEWMKYGATELQIRVIANIVTKWRPVGNYDHVPDTGIVMTHPRIKELETQVESLIDQNETIREQRDRVTMNYRDKRDLELLDTLLKTLNPRIKPDRPIMTPLELVSKDVNDVWRMCQDVIDFRRKHDIVGD